MSVATSTALTVASIAVPAATSAYGAYESSSANKEATQTQKSLSEQALAYEKERDAYARQTEANRYGQMRANLSPYVNTGLSANARMASLLGLPAPPMGQSTVPAAATVPPTSSPAPTNEPMITMISPDGTEKQAVPQSQIDFWAKKGAKPDPAQFNRPMAGFAGMR